MTRLQSQISFLLEIDKLKNVIRVNPLVGADRRENTAEHSWHLAMLALLLAEHANEPVDACRVMQMVLIHDIVEIDAGDSYAYNPTALQTQEAREHEAAQRIFGLLPPDQAAQMHALWDEFEARLTAESRFAAAIDRLMPLLHNYHTQGFTWKENSVTEAQVQARMAPMRLGSETLWQYAEAIIASAVEKGYFPPVP